MELLIVILVAVVIVAWFILTYNKFVAMIESVTNSEKEISVQLDRRGKVFDSLISTVNRYMEHEEGVFAKVTELRNQAKQGNALKDGEAHKAEDELSKIISSGELTSSLNLTMEAYPELKANENMQQLQEEIVSTENKLTFAKKAFNNAIESYNVKLKSIPDMLVPAIASSLKQDFEYWSLNEEEIKQAEDRRVEF
jgi:LemA protein